MTIPLEVPEGIEIRRVPWEDSVRVYLRSRLMEELIAQGVDKKELGPPLTASDIPVFLVALRGDIPVACGGLRPVTNDEQACEIKRMYVVPEARGRIYGTSDILMRALENEVFMSAWSVVKLATGTEMLKARRFYERHGYVRQSVFGHYTDSGDSMYYGKQIGIDRYQDKAGM